MKKAGRDHLFRDSILLVLLFQQILISASYEERLRLLQLR